MNILKLAVAAAITLSSLAVPAAASAAQNNDRDRGGDRWHNDNGRHHGWRGNRHRVCRWVWRHHHRQRICTWRYDRYRR